jgi:leukotriene-A4 hydrolase
LTPDQTAGKKYPYVYTQNEPIYGRSMFPVQDTPAVKSLFKFRFTVQDPMTVFATGNKTGEYKNMIPANTTTIYYESDILLPSYLVSFAAGNIQQQKVGRRTYVLSEPEELPKAAAELDELQYSLDLAEMYLTPYIWGDYKILILPPSFPFGGMENPLLTFASPTIIVGDKSQVFVATHEICHSWSGNQVTGASW